jgi:hypothetical protein
MYLSYTADTSTPGMLERPGAGPRSGRPCTVKEISPIEKGLQDDPHTAASGVQRDNAPMVVNHVTKSGMAVPVTTDGR